MDDTASFAEEDKAKILIVDDEQDVRDVLVAIVGRDAQYRVLNASDGVAAQEILRNETVDVVVTDAEIFRNVSKFSKKTKS